MESKLHSPSLRTFSQRKHWQAFFQPITYLKLGHRYEVFTIFSLEMRRSATVLGWRRMKTKTVFTGTTGRQLVQFVCVSVRVGTQCQSECSASHVQEEQEGDAGGRFSWDCWPRMVNSQYLLPLSHVPAEIIHGQAQLPPKQAQPGCSPFPSLSAQHAATLRACHEQDVSRCSQAPGNF